MGMTRYKTKLPRGRIKRRVNPTMPTEPGRYYWTEWSANVEVTRRRGKLYVTPPGGIEIAVTPNIAGTFMRNEVKA